MSFKDYVSSKELESVRLAEQERKDKISEFAKNNKTFDTDAIVGFAEDMNMEYADAVATLYNSLSEAIDDDIVGDDSAAPADSLDDVHHRATELFKDMEEYQLTADGIHDLIDAGDDSLERIDALHRILDGLGAALKEIDVLANS